MKNTWYISFLLLALAILGISVEQKPVPNQEIVIQFTDQQASLDKTDAAIALVKEQLVAVDAENIRIQESENGALKITYYSDVTVSEIEKIFSSTTEVFFENTLSNRDSKNGSTPSEENVQDYQLDVYEIQEGTGFANTSGNVVESKSETTRFYTPDVYFTYNKEQAKEQCNAEKSAYVLSRTQALTIDRTSRKIPEVRAGPTA